MSILDINYKKISKKYLFFTIFCLVFSLIYEMFSHGVYSYFMILSFLIPLLMGFTITIIFDRFNIKLDALSLNLYNMSVITLTFGSIIKGVLDIYGTTNSLVYLYLFIGITLLVLTTINIIKNKYFK